jgi:hypothetical protein
VVKQHFPVSTRAVLAVCILAAPVLCIPQDAHAQSGQRERNAAKRTPVSLIVRPRVGDTLQLQMEQTIEVSSRPANKNAPQRTPALDGTRTPPATSPRPDYGPSRTRASMRITQLVLYAHSFVESSDLTVTTLLATTDSMAMWAGAPGEARDPQSVPLPLEGRQVRVRVSPDGAMRVNDPPPGAMELGATLAAMPGLLPSGMSYVGDQWERDITLPSLPVSGYRADGVVRAKFRLDSLTKSGRMAWISLSGTMHRDGTSRDLPMGTRVITAGTMEGRLVVDRDRAWIIDARTVMDVQSEVAPGANSTSAPVILDMRITQRVQAK